MELRKDYLELFDSAQRPNDEFWVRHGGMPPLKRLTVMDVGCGLGRLCVEMALAGAGRVVGLDINQEYIDFSEENLIQHYPHLQGVVEFTCTPLEDYADAETFDYMISKEALEHFMDLPGMLAQMKMRLKPGGRIYAGFGPLWNSPYGDHRMANSIIPWGHLLKPEWMIIRGSNPRRKANIKSIDDLGLNRLSLADYRRIFRESGMNIVRFEVNQGSNIVSRVLSLFRRAPFLEEYCTHNIYCILEKEKSRPAASEDA